MSVSWKQTRDRGSPWLIDVIIWIILNMGRTTGRIFLFPIVSYFILTSKTRHYSWSYLKKNFKTQEQKNINNKKPGISELFRHYYSFSNMLLDRVYFLTGKIADFEIKIHNEKLLMDYVQQGKGLVLLGSHLGNFDALRVLAKNNKEIKVRALMYDSEQQNINRAFEKLNPELKKDVIHIGSPDAMLKVQEDIVQGYIIGMLADRVEQDNRAVQCDFMGQKAVFPTGPLIVAHLLKAPVIICFALHRKSNQYDIYFHLLSDKMDLKRETRDQQLHQYVQKYVSVLEEYACRYPYNWYNFYDFWQEYD